jgi:hypothetical protein
MTRLRQLLQASDPLSHEAPQHDVRRDQIRRVVIAAASDSSATSHGVGRRPFVAVMTAAALMIVAAGIIGVHVWSPGVTTLQAAVRFEVRLAEDQPAAGLIAARVANSNRTVYLHPEVVVTNTDIAFSSVIPGNTPSERFWIDVRLNGAGAAKMRRATMNHLGRPVAILIDGDVVSAPTVKSPVGAAAVISGEYTRAEAERIAQGMNPNQ